MAGTTWLISDTHFGHENSWAKFKWPGDDSRPLRPFTSTEEMDEFMVDKWNSVVKPQDRIYHLGDVVIARRNMHILGRLNGRKKLVRGNHDIFNLDDYAAYFDDIVGSHKLGDHLLTHIPVHRASIARWSKGNIHGDDNETLRGNIHGHLHANRVCKMHNGVETKELDPLYYCVSVENINFTPIAYDEVAAIMEKAQ